MDEACKLLRLQTNFTAKVCPFQPHLSLGYVSLSWPRGGCRLSSCRTEAEENSAQAACLGAGIQGLKHPEAVTMGG